MRKKNKQINTRLVMALGYDATFLQDLSQVPGVLAGELDQAEDIFEIWSKYPQLGVPADLLNLWNPLEGIEGLKVLDDAADLKQIDRAHRCITLWALIRIVRRVVNRAANLELARKEDPQQEQHVNPGRDAPDLPPPQKKRGVKEGSTRGHYRKTRGIEFVDAPENSREWQIALQMKRATDRDAEAGKALWITKEQMSGWVYTGFAENEHHLKAPTMKLRRDERHPHWVTKMRTYDRWGANHLMDVLELETELTRQREEAAWGPGGWHNRNHTEATNEKDADGCPIYEAEDPDYIIKCGRGGKIVRWHIRTADDPTS